MPDIAASVLLHSLRGIPRGISDSEVVPQFLPSAPNGAEGILFLIMELL